MIATVVMFLLAIFAFILSITNTFLSLKKGGTVDFIPMSDTLFGWAKQWISKNS